MWGRGRGAGEGEGGLWAPLCWGTVPSDNEEVRKSHGRTGKGLEGVASGGRNQGEGAPQEATLVADCPLIPLYTVATADLSGTRYRLVGRLRGPVPTFPGVKPRPGNLWTQGQDTVVRVGTCDR